MADQFADTRVGIYGGTFAPVHNAHVETAKLFMEQMRLDYLFIIPSAIPPHKEMENPVSAAHRMEMCRLAFAGMEGVYVSDMEIRRGGRSYTVDTLRELSGEDRRLFLLMGTDEMLALDGRAEAEDIFSLSYPVYVRREKDPTLDAQIVETISRYHKKYGKVVRRIVTDPIEASSGAVRACIRKGVPTSAFLPPSVEKYILDNHLYV